MKIEKQEGVQKKKDLWPAITLLSPYKTTVKRKKPGRDVKEKNDARDDKRIHNRFQIICFRRKEEVSYCREEKKLKKGRNDQRKEPRGDKEEK